MFWSEALLAVLLAVLIVTVAVIAVTNPSPKKPFPMLFLLALLAVTVSQGRHVKAQNPDTLALPVVGASVLVVIVFFGYRGLFALMSHSKQNHRSE